MGLFSYLLSGPINDYIKSQVDGRYNYNTFQFLGVDQPIALPDNQKTYVQAYLNVKAVMRCVSLRVDKVASVPFILYEIKEGKTQKFKEFKALNRSQVIEQKGRAQIIKAQTLTEVDFSQITNLLNKPNGMQSWEQWVKDITGAKLLTGNSYAYLNGPSIFPDNPDKNRYTEMFVLPTARIEIVSGGMFNPVKGYKMDSGTERAADYPASQVLHWKTYNPEYASTGSQLYGVSPLRAYLNTVLRDQLGDKELNRQIKNGGSFGFISPKNREDMLGSDQKKELKQRMVDAKKSNDEISRIFPSSIPLEWQQVGLTVDDLQLLAIKSVDEMDIYKAYNVPLQYANQEASTYDNQEIANRQFVYNAIAPDCDELAALLTEKICGPINKQTNRNFVIYADYNSLPEMQTDMKKVSEWLDKSPELTMNEKREVKGFGRLEVPGMDDVWINGNLIRIQDAAMSSEDFTNAFNEAE